MAMPKKGIVTYGQLMLAMLLLSVVLVEVVYLSSTFRMRLDLTEDGLYSLTDSTRDLLSQLEDQLTVEAYFSPDAEIPATYREGREALRNVLDEYVQNSGGKMRITYYDPKSDPALRERALRLGIDNPRVSKSEIGGVTRQELWQGVRMRYGGNRWEVVNFPLSAGATTFFYEASLSPRIKALTVTQKEKIGVAHFLSESPLQVGVYDVNRKDQPIDFTAVFEQKPFTDRYEYVKFDLQLGQHVPEEIETLLVIRPKTLGNRQKYVLDQFLMRGGKLVVFADTSEYSLGQSMTLTELKVDYDGGASDFPFVDFLEHHGIKTRTDVVADLAADARANPRGIGFLFRTPQGNGIRMRPFYPYWIRPVGQDWAEIAERAANGDEQLAMQYQQRFKPGVDPEIARVMNAPPMFWPCPVDLADPMPDGLDGRVLMRTSPFAFADKPKERLHPLGNSTNVTSGNIANQDIAYQSFEKSIQNTLAGEPRRQIGLMASVEGTFSSAFTDREIPLTEQQIEEKQRFDQEADPLRGGQSEPKTDKDEVGPDLGAGATTGSDTPWLEGEPQRRTTSEEGAQLVVIGDSEFLRDDLILGRYVQSGGPFSVNEGLFFLIKMLDWLVGEQDLIGLLSRDLPPRRLEVVDSDNLTGSTRDQEEARIAKARVLQGIVVGVPPGVLLVFGIVTLVRRRQRKAAFLTGLSGAGKQS